MIALGDLLRARLLPELPPLPLKPQRSDYDMNPSVRPSGAYQLKPAAVLIPVIARAEPTVLFTQRSENLPRHPGQVSFPGGCAQEDDATLADTALRELEEETGISRAFVTIAGFLGGYETATGYAVLPVVGMVREGFTLSPDEREVAKVFEVPLHFLLDPANCQEHRLAWKGGMRRVHAFLHDTHYIWGATAAILVDFAQRLAAP